MLTLAVVSNVNISKISSIKASLQSLSSKTHKRELPD